MVHFQDKVEAWTLAKVEIWTLQIKLGLGPRLFNLYAEYIMRNTGLEETQTVIKIAGRNINNLRYVDDITLMAESEEELKRDRKSVV